MKHYAPFIIFFLFTSLAALTSIDSYRTTKHRIIADLNQALEQTLSEQKRDWITTDTILACRQLQASQQAPVFITIGSKDFRKHLSINQLKDKAILQFQLAEGPVTPNSDEALLQSDTLLWKVETDGVNLAFRAQTPCTFASIFAMSDQRIPLALWLGAVLWITGAVFYQKRRLHKDGCISLGDLSYSPGNNSFRNTRGEDIHFTPMQRQLMQLFFQSPSFLLTKEYICKTLWPGKEDASETLYTLIKRLRPIIEENGRIHIETDRGRAYRLIHK